MDTIRAITLRIVRRSSGQSSRFARLRPLRGFGLDRPCGAPPEGQRRDGPGIRSDEPLELKALRGKERRKAMLDRTPSAIDVTIGGETHVYEAFVTTAPMALDEPSTVTLCESSFAEVAGWSADPIP